MKAARRAVRLKTSKAVASDLGHRLHAMAKYASDLERERERQSQPNTL